MKNECVYSLWDGENGYYCTLDRNLLISGSFYCHKEKCPYFIPKLEETNMETLTEKPRVNEKKDCTTLNNIGDMLTRDELTYFAQEHYKTAAIEDKKLKRNGSGYLDETAYRAIKHLDQDEEKERFHKLLKTIFTVCEIAGFHLEERVVLKDKTTGKVWR